MKRNRQAINALLLLMLVGCIHGEKAFDGKLVDPKMMVDQKQFIKESAKRMETTSKYGPKITEIDDTNIREQANTFVSKEEARSYVNMEAENDFPVDIHVENVDIRTFTQMLSKMTGINFLVSDEVSGSVTAELHDVPWTNVLDSVLNLKSLAKHVDNKANVIRIHSQEAIVKLEGFERQRREDMQKTIVLDRAAEPFYTEVFKLFYSKPDKMKTLLAEVIGISATPATGSGPAPQITIDSRMNQLIIKARKEDMDVVRKLIAKLDTRTKQIFIEAFIVEASDDFNAALGTRFGGNLTQAAGYQNKTFNVRATGITAGADATAVAAGTTDATFTDLAATGANSGIGLLAGIGGASDLKLELSALESKSLGKVISNPRLFTLDNQEAIIFQGTQVPYSTTSADGTKVEFKDAGLKLAVTPSVVGDGNLIMAIAVNKDTVDLSQPLPPITKSSITTNLVTKDGSIVVIGGIYTQTKADSNDKVPGFGDIPVAGKLFRRDSNENHRKELMIFIAPKIL